MKNTSWTSWILNFAILFVARSYTRRWSASIEFVTVKNSSFGRVADCARSCCGTPTTSGVSGRQVPASMRAMNVSRSWPTKSVFESSDQVRSCGWCPTPTRATSFIVYGSMIETLLAMRLPVAIQRASGDTARLCGILPTAIWPTTEKVAPPSRT